MKAVREFVLVAVLGFTASLALASNAKADFQVSKIENATNFNIGGRFRWGNGAWVGFQMASGEGQVLWNNRQAGDKPLFVEFDADPGPGTDTVGYRIRTYLSPTTLLNGPPTETFRIRPDGRIELYSARP